MNNNLKQAKKDLKAFAKKTKDIKYSESLLFSYLMTGMVTFSVGMNTSSDVLYEKTNKELIMSADRSRVAIKKTRKENEETLEELNLELVQLMEQGDHVVKSPWNSWQFGANFYYDNWHGAFKGKGDKIYKNQVYLKQSQNFPDSFLRYITDKKNLNSYNLTELNIVPEYPVTVSISAGIRPKSVNKAETTFVPQPPSGSLPPFEPKMVGTLSKLNSPTLTPPSFFTPPTITANGQSFSQRATIGHRDKDEFLNQISPSYPNQSVTQNYDSYSNTGTINIADSANTNSINIGMFTNDIGTTISNDGTLNAGTVENHGTINVNNDYGIGMYAVGNGSKAVNYGTINLDGKGNFKADLNFGIENQRFGVTLNAGYDTKGENMRGRIGFRAIY